MPWCPKCKNEYRDGIKVCSECGLELVNEIEVGRRPVMFGEQDYLQEIREFLEYNNLNSIEITYDNCDGVYELYVLNDDYEKASKLVKVFAEQKRILSLKDEEVITEDNGVNETIEFKAYYNSEKQAEENKSSAWMLFIVGIIGIIVLILGMAGIIPLQFGSPYLFYGVMSAIFILFIVMGVISIKNAKIFERKAESENTLKSAIVEWVNNNLTIETIDEHIGDISELSSEELYFKRSEEIKKLINHKFVNLDQVFLEHFIDEELYDNVFEK